MTEKYQWPPKQEPRPERPGKHPVHAVITALPMLMLFIGLFIYFRGESEQSTAAPILAEAQQFAGTVKGVSLVGAANAGRHYFWIATDAGDRSVRTTAEQAVQLEELEKGLPVDVTAAPTVAGSTTLWVVSVNSESRTLNFTREP